MSNFQEMQPPAQQAPAYVSQLGKDGKQVIYQLVQLPPGFVCPGAYYHPQYGYVAAMPVIQPDQVQQAQALPVPQLQPLPIPAMQNQAPLSQSGHQEDRPYYPPPPRRTSQNVSQQHSFPSQQPFTQPEFSAEDLPEAEPYNPTPPDHSFAKTIQKLPEEKLPEGYQQSPTGGVYLQQTESDTPAHAKRTVAAGHHPQHGLKRPSAFEINFNPPSKEELGGAGGTFGPRNPRQSQLVADRDKMSHLPDPVAVRKQLQMQQESEQEEIVQQQQPPGTKKKAKDNFSEAPQPSAATPATSLSPPFSKPAARGKSVGDRPPPPSYDMAVKQLERARVKRSASAYGTVKVTQVKELLPSWVTREECDKLLHQSKGDVTVAINTFFDKPEAQSPSSEEAEAETLGLRRPTKPIPVPAARSRPNKQADPENPRVETPSSPPSKSPPQNKNRNSQLRQLHQMQERRGSHLPAPQQARLSSGPPQKPQPSIPKLQMAASDLEESTSSPSLVESKSAVPVVSPRNERHPNALSPREEKLRPAKSPRIEKGKSASSPRDDNAARRQSIVTPRKSSMMSPRSPRALPPDLQSDIMQFQFEDYAKQYFEQHKRGFFRRRIPFKEMLSFQAEPLQSSLIKFDSPKLTKEAIAMFSLTQLYMGDKEKEENEHQSTDPVRIVQKLISKGLTYAELRDETYCQMCKQITNHPNAAHCVKGWELLTLVVDSFQPSRGLEPYVKKFMFDAAQATGWMDADRKKIPDFAFHCLRRLAVNARTRFAPRLPNPHEIKSVKTAPFANAIFGGTIEDMMENQQENDEEFADLRVPRVLVALTDCIEKSGGYKAEGIFRVSASAEKVSQMKMQIESGDFDLAPTNPHTPACLLKQWIAELAEPVVPADLYDLMLQNRDSVVGVMSVISQFPQDHKEVLFYLVRFIQRVAAHQAVTKMTLSNLSLVFSPNMFRCPNDDPMQALQNTKLESETVLTMIKGMDMDRYTSRS